MLRTQARVITLPFVPTAVYSRTDKYTEYIPQRQSTAVGTAAVAAPSHTFVSDLEFLLVRPDTAHARRQRPALRYLLNDILAT